MRVDVIGPLSVRDGSGGSVSVGGSLPQRLIALLVAGGRSGVAVDRLVDALWSGDAPATALASLRNTVSRLRSRCGLSVEHVDGRYRLGAAIDTDLWELERLAASGDIDASMPPWRGAPFDGFEDLPSLLIERERVAETYAAHLELIATSALDDDVLRRSVAGLRTLLATDPLRESAVVACAVAMYRLGRQSDALRLVRDAVSTIREQTGLEPSGRLGDVEQAILQRRIDPMISIVDGVDARRVGERSEAPRERLDPILGELGRDVFIGRETEVASLLHAVKRGRDLPASLVLVRGEAGIGKTWLLAEFARRATSEGFAVAYGRSDPSGALPLQCWSELVRSLGGLVPSAELRAAVGDLAPSAERLCPGLVGGLDGPMPTSGDAVSERNRLNEACARIVRAVARSTMCVLVLDDLQWLTVEDVAILRHVIATARNAVVVGAIRIGEPSSQTMSAALRDELAAPRGVEIELDGLAEPDVAELVEQLGGSRFDAHDLRRITRRTAGSPLAIGQIMRTVPEGAGLPFVDELMTPSSGDALVVAGATAVLDRLPSSARDVLAVVAVVGIDATLQDVSTLTRHGVDEVIDRLESAFRSNLLLSRGDTVSFSHAVYRDALYDEMPSPRRERLHALLAETSTSIAPPQRCYHALAGSAHLAASAIAASVRAAVDWLTERGSFTSTFDLVDRVLRRSEIVAGDTDLRLDLMRVRARCALVSGETEAARAEYEEVARDALRAGLSRHAAQVAIEYDDFGRTMSALSPRFELLTEALGLDGLSEGLRVEVAAERINEGFFYGRTRGRDETVALRAESATVLADAERLAADRSDAERPLVAALNARHMALLADPPARTGDPRDDRVALSSSLLDAARRLGDPVYLGVAFQDRLHDLLQLGRIDEAEDLLAEYWQLVARCRLPRVRWMGHMMSSAVGRVTGDVEGADAELDEMVRIGLEHGYVDTEPCRLAHRIVEALDSGDTAHLLDEIEPVMTGFFLPEWRLIHAIARADSGDTESADAVAADFWNGYDDWPRNVFWQTSLAFAAHLLARVDGHDELRARVRSELSDFGDADIVIGAVVCVLGPAASSAARCTVRATGG